MLRTSAETSACTQPLRTLLLVKCSTGRCSVLSWLCSPLCNARGMPKLVFRTHTILKSRLGNGRGHRYPDGFIAVAMDMATARLCISCRSSIFVYLSESGAGDKRRSPMFYQVHSSQQKCKNVRGIHLSSWSPPDDPRDHRRPMYKFALSGTRTHLTEHS
jgi:hypothetical protein